MYIDAYSCDWFDAIQARTDQLSSNLFSYLLIDGAFVPGLHRQGAFERKALLFESLPACTEEMKDVSPFLVPVGGIDKPVRRLLERCKRWPMVSLIDTPETLDALSKRLAAWCIVEADGQRFNFRFPDTRRLPGIYQALTATQRAQLLGPAARWSYVARDGRWAELSIEAAAGDIATDPVLDPRQFAALVDDSRIDELLSLLSSRGQAVYRQPSKSHALLTGAYRIAAHARLPDDEMLDWCEWCWMHDQLLDDASAEQALAVWRRTTS
ncbi:MAG: DUF4123 domain-containing protein [Pseudomonadota bacterium]